MSLPAVVLGAGNLAEYGDPRALELLVRALDDYELAPADDNLMTNQEVIELTEAIVDLGGTLTERQRRKRERVSVQRERWRDEQRDDRSSSAAERPGRNDPCHCGSGKKYKKCHLATDESAPRL